MADSPSPAPPIYRPEALEKLSSPERIDELVVIVSPRHWVTLAALALIVATALAWAVAGSVSVAVQGAGVLVPRSTGAGVAESPTTPGQPAPSQLGPPSQPGTSREGLGARVYVSISDGRAIKPGMTVRITPDTGRTEPLTGRVVSVSAWPVSREAVALQVGGAERAALILGDVPRLEVEVDRLAGPSIADAVGQAHSAEATPVHARITLDARAPISYLIPGRKR